MPPEWRVRAGARTARLLLDSLLGTCRFEDHGTEHFRRRTERGQGVIFALWHGRLLPLSYRFRGNGFVPMISRSADGDYIARVVEGWGYVPVRGSASRGGREALRDMVRHARAGRSLVLTPDGPRGPFHELKEGVLTAAQLSGLPIVPAAAGASRAWWFGRWDRFLVPQPFARIVVLFGAPIAVPRDASAAVLASKKQAVTASLNALLEEADARASAA
ncbi:MAG TPA: lysophospholipid acyltransferase family protein [Longimicrobiales bacterium]|nr:lysophospholipid acyltransferase family protein [Longimicrobiales bacterium]